MKFLILILSGLILIFNNSFSNSDYYDIPLSNYSHEQHKIVIPEEPKADKISEVDLNLIYTILLRSDYTQVRVSDIKEFSLSKNEDELASVIVIYNIDNSTIEVEK